MLVLPEDLILSYLDRCLKLLQAALPLIKENGTSQVSGKLLNEYEGLIKDLLKQRGNDSYLSDESWNWIFKEKSSYNYLQLYGRLSWINLQLFDLM